MKLPKNRNLYNIDCDAFFYKYNPQSYWYRPDEHRFTARDIHEFVDVLADSGVDTVLVNPNGQLIYYPSKALRSAYAFKDYRRGDKSFFYGHYIGFGRTSEQLKYYFDDLLRLADREVDLQEQGVDWLAEAAQACRRRGLAPWLSIRMNDMHGGTRMPEASWINCELFKDPSMRLRGVTNNPKEPHSITWAGLNFEKKKVRDYMFSIIRDGVENYDYEGLELDWSRVPLCCEPDATQEATDLITAWHGEIRALTEKRARETGKPYPVALRYLGSLDQLRSIGIDVRAMARQGIIDCVLPTNSWQTSWDIPYDALRAELGPDIAIYGVIEDAPNWMFALMPHEPTPNVLRNTPLAENYRLLSASAPMLRGNAAGKLALGADGIETYNFFCTDTTVHWPWAHVDCHAAYPALKGLEDLEGLRGQVKFYTFSSKGGMWSNLHFETIGQVPFMLEPGWRQELRLSMCREPADAGLSLTIQVVLDRQSEQPEIGISFNGCWPSFEGQPSDELLVPAGALTHHSPYHQALNVRFDVAQIKEGWNSVLVCNGSKGQTLEEKRVRSTHVVSVELAVKTA